MNGKLVKLGRLDKVSKVNKAPKNYLQMDKIMKRLFTLKNKRPIIDFLNAVYKDDISYAAKIKYGNTEINNPYRNRYITFYADLYMTVEDESRNYEYALEFQTVFEKDMAIRIFRYSFERAVKLGTESNNKNYIEINLPNPYLIVLEEEKDLGDTLMLKINVPKGDSFSYAIDVLRYWSYNLEELHKENMYLLYPLQLFKLRKTMEKISSSKKSYGEKKVAMLNLYEDLKGTIEETLKAIDKAYTDGKINISDYNEMNVVIENLNSYFTHMYGKYGDVDEEVRDLVKSFYDPKIKEEGIEEGIERGIEKARLKDIERVKKLLIKRFGNLETSLTEKIEKTSDESLGAIIENILDIEDIGDVEKYL